MNVELFKKVYALEQRAAAGDQTAIDELAALGYPYKPSTNYQGADPADFTDPRHPDYDTRFAEMDDYTGITAGAHGIRRSGSR